MGGLGLPACTRRPVRRGSAAHLVLFFLAGVSPAVRSQGSVAGERPRLPRGSRRSLDSPRLPSARPSARPQPSQAYRVAAAIFFSLPGIGRIAARARGAGSSLVCRNRPPMGPQGHRGVWIGIFLHLRTALTMGG
ncbi:hypothetical protein NDU88_000874 [Pleurodeles waltl]|uniref:Uncharacterized protein n=1 Tax=Pleurodeles waltl TaxID=8319 RepID=A0AAV7KR78_PLEWA|nr:hypothetical protein NDU88_000874 [Pleurodeles waltl]